MIAASVYAFLHGNHGKRAINRLREKGLDLTAPLKPRAAETSAGQLAGKTLVVTGTLDKYSREEIHALIEQHGGKAGSSVSKKTAYLVAGAEAGSKLAKAQSLGVPVLTEAEFEALLASASS